MTRTLFVSIQGTRCRWPRDTLWSRRHIPIVGYDVDCAYFFMSPPRRCVDSPCFQLLGVCDDC